MEGEAPAPQPGPTLAKETEPKDDGMIEVWRPGRPEERRPRHVRPRGERRPERRGAPAAPALAEAAKPEVPAVPAEPVAAAPAPNAAPRPDRQQHRRGGRKPDRPDRPRRRERDGPDAGERAAFSKNYGAPKERRDKAPDPNSPFAKLAALKEQLEANAKERR